MRSGACAGIAPDGSGMVVELIVALLGTWPA
jgi:hypothetical protein